MNRAELRKRWSAQELKRINIDLERGNCPRDALQIVHGGVSYVDLRGISISRTVAVQTIDRWDLSEATFELSGAMRVHKQTAINSLFVGLRFEGNIGSQLNGCDFSSARLRCTFMGRFERCVFYKADLRNMGYSHDRHFFQCDFTEANLTDADLNDAIFEECIWDRTKFGGGVANGTKWIGTCPTDKQLASTFILTPEEAERERQIMQEIQDSLRRQKGAASKTRRR